MKHKLKRILSICALAAALGTAALGAGPSAAASTGETPAARTEDAPSGAVGVKEKDEVVYAALSADGGVDSVYVVNHFETDGAGEIVDYGDYASVQNLTDTGEIAREGDRVAFVSGGESFYYQGDMEGADLPWTFGISYALDGEELAARDMAGKSGAMEMRLKTARNAGVDSTFYDNYMLQITVTLDTGKTGNIDAPKGTEAEAGGSRVVAYTVMPGTDGDFTLKADVNDFEMAGVQVSGIPYAMEIDVPDTDESFDDIDKLPEAISELNEGVGELAGGTDDMKEGADRLTSGSAGIRDGLSLLSGSSAQLADGSAKINDALAAVSGALNGGMAGGVDLSQMEGLPAGLSALAANLREISGGFSALKDGTAQGIAAMDGAMAGIPDVPESDIQEAAGLGNAAVDQLIGAYTAAQTAKGTYAVAKPGFEAVGSAIDRLAPGIEAIAQALDGIAAQTGAAMQGPGGLEQLPQLAAGLKELSGQYSGFHAGLTGYVSGVDTLAANYGSFHAGLAAFGDGVGELESGVDELHDGTKTLDEEVADLPDTLKEGINKMKEQYLPAEFDAISFTSPKNTDTVYVQFVMQSQGIEKQDEEKPATSAPEEPETFWDRLTALFGGTE